ncbi:hypothetical protein GGF40_003028 [Coemansia sp. RSA 1286]|nr:hypothetical protein GGF40_003028 [Coemansia sp. RSA 1286]
MEMQSFNYPASGLLQKEVTQVAEFLNKNPTFDGRGTVIAILDTGIDPAAMGMQKTSTGKPKVIDFIDCTGAGDVEMGPAQKCPEDKPLELVGASGRTLKLNSNWKNPSGDWHLGSKPLYSIAPKEVIRALSKERTEVHNKKQELIKIDIQRKQQQLKDDDEDSDGTSDYKEQFKALDKLNGIYNDHGPLLDCVVFHDGKQWLAAIDTEESGDLTQVAAMGAYKSTGNIGMLCKRHLLYFTINFYDNGKILSIVTPSDAHSTHVSGIAAAFHPEEPASIGIAPGAQLLSLSIGDQRVDAMETGIAHMRAVNAVIEYNVDLANMSFVPTKLGDGSKYNPSTSASSGSEDNVGATDDTKESEEKETNSMEKAMRDLQISWIKSTESISVRDKLVSDLTASAKTEEDKMDVLIAHLESVDTYNRAAFPWTSKCGMTTERAIKVVEIADQIVEKTQATALTEPLYASYNEKKATDKEKEAKKKVDDAKEQITNALKSKCYAAAFLAANNMFTEKEKEIDVKTDDTDFKEKYKQALDQLVAWEDYNGSGMENMVLSLTLLVLEKKYAKALNKIFSHVEDTPLLVSNVKEHSAMSDLRDKLIKKLEWALWTDYLKAAAKFEIFEEYESF